ncbi:hypothetical protein [uncultured Stenotrophomonas sp.]|uniref:hypothetical protein n=1 Tax=uncultured Stenotrophomonas sp. TaxID=165438 RepID=UPI0025E16792|nr:hypothetical protein [uncultured Stenotrophomonas sp.]
MSRAPACRLASFALVAVLSTTACAKAPSTEKDPNGTNMSEAAASSRTVGGHTYTTEPVEARVGPHRFMFPANLYYNQTGPLADGGVMLTVLWPDFDAAPPGDRPVRTTQVSRRQVLVELRYIDRVPIHSYLERRSSSEATSAPGSLERRDPVENLALRVAQPERWGLTPYAIDPSLMAAYAKDSEAALGRPYVHNPGMEPDWYVARTTDGQLATFISCDPADRIPDGLTIQGKTLERAGEDQIAMCRHSIVDVGDSIAIEMNYARVMLSDWQRLETSVRELLSRYRVQP